MFDEDNGLDIETISKEAMMITASNSFSEEQYDLKWKAKSFSSRKLSIKLEFSEPLKIGNSLEGQDILHIQFNNTNSTFKTKDYMVKDTILHQDSQHLSKRLPKQMKNDTASE